MTVQTKAFDLVLVAVVARDADADGAVFDEVHAVGRVALPDDQLRVVQRARQQRVRQVGALVRLPPILLFSIATTLPL